MILKNKKKIIFGIVLATALNSTVAFAAENNQKPTGNVTKKISTESVVTSSSSDTIYYITLSGPTLSIETDSDDWYFTDITASANYVGRGCRNSRNEVKMCQMLLNTYGYDLDVDGKCGSATISAIRRFQSSHGLDNDGICGYDTWCSLYQNYR